MAIEEVEWLVWSTSVNWVLGVGMELMDVVDVCRGPWSETKGKEDFRQLAGSGGQNWVCDEGHTCNCNCNVIKRLNKDDTPTQVANATNSPAPITNQNKLNLTIDNNMYILVTESTNSHHHNRLWFARHINTTAWGNVKLMFISQPIFTLLIEAVQHSC